MSSKERHQWFEILCIQVSHVQLQQKKDDCFKAASYNVGTTIGELIEAGNKTGGLKNQEVQDRRRVVGRNAIEMEKPFYPYVFLQEANNPWYLYQFYLIFTWMPL